MTADLHPSQQSPHDPVKPIAVYATDRRTVVGWVGRSATSIGAARAAGALAAQLTRIGGSYVWVVMVP